MQAESTLLEGYNWFKYLNEVVIMRKVERERVIMYTLVNNGSNLNGFQHWNFIRTFKSISLDLLKKLNLTY